MERKKNYTADRQAVFSETADFLPKVAIKSKDSPLTVLQTKSVKKKYSDICQIYGDSEINIFSKFLKNESNILLQQPQSSEERKDSNIHLPVLSKKDTKKEMVSSVSNYRSPTLSPCFMKPEYEVKKTETDDAERHQSSQKRGNSASRGFKSRKTKSRPSKYSSKQREENLDILLMNRNNSDLEYLMQEYTRRQGLSESCKVFILTGQHDFMRRSLKKRGWVENKNYNSCAYHFKWCYNDSDYDYKNLKEGQLYNHFPGNRELTTKSGLTKNLRHFVDIRVNIDKFFPRSYDLGDGLQIKELIQDYKRTAILNIIKKVALGFFVDESILAWALGYSNQLLTDFYSKCEKQLKPAFELKLEEIQKIVSYEVKQSAPMSPESIETCKKLEKKLQAVFPQFYMEGCENVWIIKPGQNARGSGVRCVRELEAILDSGVKMQSRIVQKYTEKPLLIPTTTGLCKFDLRIWVLVTSFDPLKIYMYNTCYCRICQEPYTLESLDAFKHLANYSIQKAIAKSQSETVWSLTQLIEYLNSIEIPWEPIQRQIHMVIINTLLAVSDSVETREGCFELYGFDVIIDSELKPWLLEVNLSPACAERTDWITETLNFMGDGLLDIILSPSRPQPLYNTALQSISSASSNTQKWIFLYHGEDNTEECTLNKIQLEIFGEKFNIKREKFIERRFLSIRAAFVIQRHSRRFLVKIREERKRIRENVVCVQQVVRRKLAWDKYLERVKERNALMIQCWWRSVLAKEVLKSKKKIRCVEIIQAELRKVKILGEFKCAKERKACIEVQVVFRRKLAQAIVAEKQHYKSCVITIQKFYKERFKLLNHNARNIQRLVLGFLGRKKFKRYRKFIHSVISIQSCARRLFSISAVKLARHQRSSKIIGQFERLRLTLKSFSYHLHSRAATVIQKYYRRHAAIQLLKQKKREKQIFIDKICYIQKILRGIKERKRFKSLREKRAAILIQRAYRLHRAQKCKDVLKRVNSAALKIQKAFRGFKCRKRFLIMRRIYREEVRKKSNHEKKKKEQRNRAYKATERLFSRGKAPALPARVTKNERPYSDYINLKVQRMRSIYTQDDDDPYQSRYDKGSFLKHLKLL